MTEPGAATSSFLFAAVPSTFPFAAVPPLALAVDMDAAYPGPAQQALQVQVITSSCHMQES